MTSLPLLPNTSKKNVPKGHLPNRSFLKIHPSIETKTSLEKQAIDVVHNHRYLYIDFQSKNSLIELERQERNDYESEDEVEQLGNSSIAGMSRLQKVCLPSFRMHKFFNEEKHHIQKRNSWNRLLGKEKLRESMIDFNLIKEKVNPQKLEEFLESKNLEQQWKKIVIREQMLYREEESKLSPKLGLSLSLRESTLRRLRQRTKPHLHSRFKLKTLNNLNNLLQQD